jgi:hypothetical protein
LVPVPQVITVTLLLFQGNLSLLRTVSQSPREVLNICRLHVFSPAADCLAKGIFQNAILGTDLNSRISNRPRGGNRREEDQKTRVTAKL